MRYRVHKRFCPIPQWCKIRKSGPVTLTFDLWPWNSVCFNRLLSVIKVSLHVRAQFHQAKFSGPWIIVRLRRILQPKCHFLFVKKCTFRQNFCHKSRISPVFRHRKWGPFSSV